MAAELVIRANHLRKRFGPIMAVKDVYLEVAKGEIFGFLGANGSGKTTTLRMLCGLLIPDGGEGQCLGFDILKQSYQIKLNIGYMTQKFSFYEELTVLENLKFIAQMYQLNKSREKIAKILSQFHLDKRKTQLTGTLSGGLKQRLALAASLLHQPKVLLLDEPTAGVDPKARGEFWDVIHALSEQGITILVSTHYMDEAERCTRLAYMSFGNILTQGKAQEIIDQAALKTIEIQGKNLFTLASKLREQKSLQVILFGNTLHVSGKPSTDFDKMIEELRQQPDIQLKGIETTLEDVFINLMKKETSA